MTRLNQIIALEKGEKTNLNNTITKAYHLIQRTDLFAGISKTYRPRDEQDGEKLAGESKRVQITAPNIIDSVTDAFTRLINKTATKDRTNQNARADIVIGNLTLAADVPVSTLLFLEKQLIDLRTFITKLPILSTEEDWREGDQAGVWRGADRVTNRSKKIPRNHVKAAATDKHPAQVEVFYEDVVVGDWTTVTFSGALPARQVQDLLARVDKLAAAVKVAREEANITEAVDLPIGGPLLDYVFTGL